MAQIHPCGDGMLGNAEESNLSHCPVLEGVCSSPHHSWGRQVSSTSLSRGFDLGGAGQDWENCSFSVIPLWIALWYKTAAQLLLDTF